MSDIEKAIPKIFTDETLEKEKENLLRLISDVEKHKIDSQLELNRANNKLRFAEDNLNRFRELERQLEAERREAARHNPFLLMVSTYSEPFERAEKEVDKAQDNVNSIREKIDEYDHNLAAYKNQLEELEAELQKKPIQRAEEHYQKFLDQKHTITDEKEFLELAKKFREMEGYKDSEALAKECENQYRILKEQREKKEAEQQAREAKEKAGQQAKEAKEKAERQAREEAEQQAKEEAKWQAEQARKAEQKRVTIFSIVLGGTIGGFLLLFLAWLFNFYALLFDGHGFAGIKALGFSIAIGALVGFFYKDRI